MYKQVIEVKYADEAQDVRTCAECQKLESILENARNFCLAQEGRVALANNSLKRESKEVERLKGIAKTNYKAAVYWEDQYRSLYHRKQNGDTGLVVVAFLLILLSFLVGLNIIDNGNEHSNPTYSGKRVK